MKEFRVPHDEIATPQTITPAMELEFKKRGLDLIAILVRN